MENKEELYNFAIKWKNKFLDENTDYMELVDMQFSIDCEKLGFDMDCGEAFHKLYGNEKLENIIDNIDDVSLLGSAIYSQWRYFNHWAWDASEILEEPNKKWFLLVLNRFEQLSKD